MRGRPDVGNSGRSAIQAQPRRRFARLLNCTSELKEINAIEGLRNRGPAVLSMRYNAGAHRCQN